MYRFLLTPRWLGFAALMMVASAVMVALGFWQLDRYELRHGINVRVATAAKTAPVPLTSLIGLDRAATGDQEWTRVTATGTYDVPHTVLARDRTVNGDVGFEVLTPLVLADNSVLVVDRGWIAPGPQGTTVAPAVPAAPAGEVTVTGRVHLPESSPDTPATISGQPSVRRIDPANLTGILGTSSVYADYLLLDSQTPAGAGGFTAIPSDSEPAWLDAGYTVQWWMFSVMALVGFCWLARREARDLRDGVVRTPAAPRSRDRLGDDVSVPLI